MSLSLTKIYPILLLATCTLAAIAPTHLYVNRVGPCLGGSKLPVSISELSIIRHHYDFLFSGQLNITANFSNGWDVKATMQKCTDIRNIDTCDHYRSFTMVHDGCTGPNVEGFHLYSLFFHYIQPSMRCPIAPGHYRIENYPLFTQDNYLAVAEVKISTSVFGYTLKLEVFSESELILCVDTHLRLLYTRDHNWLDLDADASMTPEPEPDVEEESADE